VNDNVAKIATDARKGKEKRGWGRGGGALFLRPFDMLRRQK
jgi:hypothetical protein